MMTAREFEKIFKALYLPLGMYALKYVEDTDIAEDMVQEAFVKVWHHLSEGKDIGNLKSYIYMAVRNECINYLRIHKYTASEDDLADVPDVSDDDIDTSERDARLWRAIDSLPDRCREIFLMSKRDGMSNEEIATELDISIKTVKNQMTKAYERLRAELAPSRRPFFLPFL